MASLWRMLRCRTGVIAVKGDVTAIWGLLTSSYLNVLLLSVPLGYLAHALSWAPLLRFSLVSSCIRACVRHRVRCAL